ncbi:hypothetical protein NDU88_002903 [Pleurodeles waltl]|uniref:Uncharacterized protein n=1 Tax=Pleurodeles waltl TaxID=8319 RepID=A0AAV7MT07_PLEWA|nr:hypothetical protein NDU88_002903 [Pleurodeles waltl]
MKYRRSLILIKVRAGLLEFRAGSSAQKPCSKWVAKHWWTMVLSEGDEHTPLDARVQALQAALASAVSNSAQPVSPQGPNTAVPGHTVRQELGCLPAPITLSRPQEDEEARAAAAAGTVSGSPRPPALATNVPREGDQREAGDPRGDARALGGPQREAQGASMMPCLLPAARRSRGEEEGGGGGGRGGVEGLAGLGSQRLRQFQPAGLAGGRAARRVLSPPRAS